MKHARKAKSAAKSFLINRANAMRNMKQASLEDADGEWPRGFMRCFSDAAGFGCARKKLGWPNACYIKMWMYL